MSTCHLLKKVKLSLVLIKHHTMKMYRVVQVYFQSFLTSALDGVDWSDSQPGRFNSGESALSTHWTGGWVGPRARQAGQFSIIMVIY
jgi:hypothetical protein